MQELQVAFNVRRAPWSFVQLNSALHEMGERWPVGEAPAGTGSAEHRYIITRPAGDEDVLRFVIRPQQPLEEQEASAALQQLEELVRAHFPTGSRLWHATQSAS